ATSVGRVGSVSARSVVGPHRQGNGPSKSRLVIPVTGVGANPTDGVGLVPQRSRDGIESPPVTSTKAVARGAPVRPAAPHTGPKVASRVGHGSPPSAFFFRSPSDRIDVSVRWPVSTHRL